MRAATDRRPAWLLGELRAPAELGLFLGAFPLLHAAPRGPSRPVLVLPGFVAGDSSTLPLRALLGRLGHQPLSWGLGTNLGPTADTVSGLVRRLHEAAEQAGEPVSLVGWSLGGIYARALAQWHPELVDQVITLGSPFNIGHREPTSLDPMWAVLGRWQRFVGHRGELELDEVPCPSTALFSRTDGVVSWESCRQTEHPTAENIEVRGSHCGLGVNVAVAYAVADRLARASHEWRSFQPPSLLRPLYPGLAVPTDPPCAN